MMRRLRALVLSIGLIAGFAPLAQATATESIDTLAYVINSQPETLDGTHGLSQTVHGRNIYTVKWGPDAYENYEYDDTYLYLREDHHGGGQHTSRTFSDGKWLKRSMRVGERITNADNYVQNFTTGPCAFTSSGYFPYSTTLVAHEPTRDFGGTLGVQDTIVLQYDYRVGGGTDYEWLYYARDRGMVLRELYRNGQLIQNSLFNRLSAVPPTLPDTASACRDTPFTPSAPRLPKTIDSYLTMMYDCVLGTTPDSGDMANWRAHLENGTAALKVVYTEFFGAQGRLNPPRSDEQFARSLYNCTLFRGIDPATLATIETGLANGSLNRGSLVDSVLGSAEFNVRVLPRLQLINLNAPAFPADRSVFVGTLYSCVLNVTDPDSAGFDFWMTHLRSGRISQAELYRQFFAYQTPETISNDQFVRKLYGCTLFRPVDAASYHSTMKALANGTPRPRLVDFVVTSPEFNDNVLPRLGNLS